MTQSDIWLASTGVPLTLGLKVNVVEDNPYYQDHAGIDFFITGLDLGRDGTTVNITIGENLCSRESDGWKITDLKLARQS